MVQFPTFKSYLTDLPTDIVFRHFISRQGQVRKILSSSSINEIAHQMSLEKSIRERFSNLSLAARYTVSLVYLFGKRGLEIQDLSGFDNEILGSFLVFAGRDEGEKTFLFGFPEFEKGLAPLAAAAIIDTAKTTQPKEPANQVPWQCLCDVAMLCICASVGLLKTTRKGTFTKVSENAMKRFLHASRDMVPDETALLHRLLFCYAIEKGLLVLDKDTYWPLPHAVLSWMERPLSERYSDFCECAVRITPLWSMPVIAALFAANQRQWLSLPPAPDAERKDVRISLACLRYLGLLDVCKGGGSLAFSRPKAHDIKGWAASLPAARIILLADFSAVLTRDVLPEDLFWFSKVGTLESFDSVYRGTIRRQIINDSLSDGIDENRLVEWLETWKAPANVFATAKEWIREFSRMYITTDATIVSSDERATGQILSYEPLKRLIEPVRSHCVFRIRSGRELEVRHILGTMGFDPRMPGERAVPKQVGRGDELLFFDEAAPYGACGRTGISPVVDFGPRRPEANRTVKAGKYGQKLKELDLSDLFHVLDYAVLMGHQVAFEYRGSPLIKKGAYRVLPLHVHKAAEPTCEALVLPKKAKKKFLLTCILRIGVESA
jgi:hypothetical protein